MNNEQVRAAALEEAAQACESRCYAGSNNATHADASEDAPDAVLMPREATEAMMHAAEDVPAPRPYGAVYRAMVAARPTSAELETARLAAAHYELPERDIPALVAFERHRDEQRKIIGMPGLSALPCFIAGFHAGHAARPAPVAATPAPADPRVDNLRMLVQRLARSLSLADPGSTRPAEALDYLERVGLKSSPLRTATPAAPIADMAAVLQDTTSVNDAVIEALGELPALPKPAAKFYELDDFGNTVGRETDDYTEAQMCEYGQDCIAADRAARTPTIVGSIGEDAEFNRLIEVWQDAAIQDDGSAMQAWKMLVQFIDARANKMESAPTGAGK